MHEKMLNISNHQGNAIKTSMRYHLTPDTMAVFKNTEISVVVEDVEEKEPLCTIHGVVNWCSLYGGSSRN